MAPAPESGVVRRAPASAMALVSVLDIPKAGVTATGMVSRFMREANLRALHAYRTRPSPVEEAARPDSKSRAATIHNDAVQWAWVT